MNDTRILQIKKYHLKNKNQTLLSFDIYKEIDKYDIVKFIYKNIILHSEVKKLPKGLYCDDTLTINHQSLQHWFEKRKASEHRPNSLRFLNCGGDPSDLHRYIEINRGISLNDTYWVAPIDQDINWEEVSPYNNTLDQEIANIAFTNEFKIDFPEPKIRITAEPTTAGMLRKCWVNKADGIYLRKAYEPHVIHKDGRSPIVMEFFAVQVADIMKIKHIPYTLSQYTHRNGEREIICECPIFTSEDVGFVDALAYIDRAYLNSTGKRWKCDNISSYGTQMVLAELFGVKYYSDMMLFDTIILNQDRHFGNFGMLVDNNTGEYLDPAPLFDNGNALIATAQDISDYNVLMENIYNNYAKFMTFDEQAYCFVEERHIPMLKKLTKFSFQQPLATTLRISTQALESMSNIVRIRSKRALELLEKKQKEFCNYNRREWGE